MDVDRWPQTDAGRRAEGALSMTEAMVPREAWTPGASISGGVIAVPRLTLWHDVPGSCIGKLLQAPEEWRGAVPEQEIPPRPWRPPPSADEPTAPVGTSARHHAVALANRLAFMREPCGGSS